LACQSCDAGKMLVMMEPAKALLRPQQLALAACVINHLPQA
jgi:hypothetical protein